MSAMIKKLEDYYRKEGISSLDFRCLHAPSCRKGYNDFTEAKATLVGAGYEQSIPRLVFVSLDPGGEEYYRRPENRTLLSVQKYEMERDITALPKNRHWYRTVELALNILKKFDGYNDLQINKATRHFAHINTVKCCVNNPGNKTAHSQLFKNCRRFVPHELEILKPNIIVTQGEQAQRSIENCFREYDNSKYLKLVSDHPELSMLNINKHPVLWIHTYHPSCYGSFNRQRREKFLSYTERSKDFIALLRKNSRIKSSLKPSVPDINNKTGKREAMSTFEKGLKLVINKLRSLGAKHVITFKKGNNKRISASNGDRTRTVIIATKTKNKGTWQTSIDYGNPQNVSLDDFHYWVFVDLSTPTDPQFYVVRERWISHDINKVHKKYLSKHGGVRAQNKESKHHKITLDRIKQWHERWDLLKIF